MAIIFKSSDRVKLTIGEITLVLSPLTYGQKIEVAARTRIQKDGEQRINMALLAHLAIKYSLKNIVGVNNADKSKYGLSFEDKNFTSILGEKKEAVLTDECAEELIEGLTMSPSITTIAYQLINGIPDYIEDNEGNKAKGVKLEIMGKHKATKKKKK